MPLFLPPAFGFASPWLLLGLGLAAIPVIIHLLFRRPYREVPWAATRFLISATKKHAKRLRLEQLLLLAVRIAALLLVAVALARPYLGTRQAAAGPDPPRHRVIVLDSSYSMGHESGGRTRFDVAKDAIRDLIDSAKRGDAFHLVRMTDLGPRIVIGRAAYQPSQVIETLDEQSVSSGRADPLAAMRDVSALLRQASELPNKEVLIFSDFQQADWRPSGERSDELRKLLDGIGKAATVRIFDAAHPSEANSVVSDLVVDGSFVRAGEAIRFTVTVLQHGESDRQRERVELYVDNRLVGTETIPLRPGESSTVTFSHVFAEAGPHGIEVRLPNDALPADNQRYLAVSVRDRLRVLLVNGTTTGQPERTATFYLRQALAPLEAESAASESDFEPTIIGEGELASTELADYDAVVLANVGVITDREADRLHAFAIAGGGVVITLGDNVRPPSYNRLFAEGGDRAMSPVRLTERIGNPTNPELAVQFDTSDLSHAVVQPFAGNPGTGLDTDFVLAYAKATLAEDAQAGVVLRFDTGDPALVANQVGAGRVLLLTTSLDTTWGGPWPQAGRSYLPLVHEIVRYAASGQPAGQSAIVGEPLTWTVPERVAGLTARILGPNDSAATVPAVVGASGVQVTYDEADQTGIYTFSLGSPIGKSAMFAVNVDAREGDLTSLSEQERTALVPRGRIFIPGLATGGSTSGFTDWSFSRWLLAIAFGLLLVEPLLAWRFAWGLAALGALALILLTRAAWLADPFLGAVVGVFGLGALAAVLAVVRKRG